MAGPHGGTRGTERLRELEQADADRAKRLERLARAGWSFRYDGARDEFVLTRHEVRGRTLEAAIEAAESSG